MEVEDSLGNVGLGEREYVISPQHGASVMKKLELNAASDHRVCQIKKPFDWMLDDQFHNLQLLAINYEWFQDMFERMPKDGRETQWRTLGEHENPELHPLPEKMDDHYNPMQRLMVIRAFRSDRIMQASSVFVAASLGKKYTYDVPMDCNVMLRQSSPTIPILLLYTREGDLAERLFNEFAAKKQMTTTIVSLSNAEPGEERRARKVIQRAMQDGTWVLLKSAHNATHLLNALETLLHDNANKQGGESPFRVWICGQISPSIPTRLLQYAVKAVIDTPKIVKEGLLRAVSSFDADQLKACSRMEWVPLLHNIAMLHATVRLRGRFGLSGWNYPEIMDFSHNELSEAFNIARQIFHDNPSEGDPLKGVSWIGLRYILTEIIYGSYINDDSDRNNLSAMVDYWIGPNATKKEFEATKLRYRIPAAFFSNVPRIGSLSQSIEAMPNHFLDVPEACGMHTSYETVLGDDQYVFTRLNQVLDAMPSSHTLSHALQPRPATPFHGDSVASVNGTALQPTIASMGVYASASRSLIKSKRETEIWEICHSIISKIPKGWNRDYITERMRKVGGDTPFNRFILREIDLMIRLITELKATFNKLKTLCENPNETFGDQMSERLIDIADDLFHHRIPAVWCEMLGDSAPPPNWTLAQWMTDLTQRCQHMERIIVQGRDKFPSYWLGAFFQPRALLALLRQDAIRAFGHNISQSEPVVFQTEITARDKDHVRDPPQEGMFVYGIYVWGCSWEKTTGELQDSPPRHGATLLPILHITCMPYSEKPAYNESRTSEMYLCPVYPTRTTAREPVFLMDVKHDNISASKWALRGLAATIRPY